MFGHEHVDRGPSRAGVRATTDDLFWHRGAMDSGRSYLPITPDDLRPLRRIAESDRERFFDGRPEYRDRVVCVALCQGAGLHYVDVVRGSPSPNGVKDFDVWSFFAAIPDARFPADRRNMHVDLGPTKFGRWAGEPPRFRHYQGRRVDLLMRALPVEADADPVGALTDYLRAAPTKSARLLAAKGVVLIDPADRRGEIVWPI